MSSYVFRQSRENPNEGRNCLQCHIAEAFECVNVIFVKIGAFDERREKHQRLHEGIQTTEDMRNRLAQLHTYRIIK